MNRLGAAGYDEPGNLMYHEPGKVRLYLWFVLLLALFLLSVGCRSGSKKTESPARSAITADAGMVFIPAGPFTMGTNEGTEVDGPEHLVTTEAYWIDKYEYPNVLGEMPLVNVTWYQAKEICESLGKRLCTEREWEKAARGPENWLYPYGNIFDPDACRTEKDWQEGPVAIGTTNCLSGYGVADMSGNVMEWTLGEGVEERVVRGGDWQGGKYRSRATTRVFFHPTYYTNNIGFRCAKSVDGEDTKVP